MVDKNPQKIKNMFNEISSYYDLMNNFISLGTHYFVKITALKLLKIQSGENILDICCGTGDFTRIIRKLCPKAKVIGLDFSEGMIKKARQQNPNEEFIIADCTNLPFNDEEFDYITAGFGLRNIENRTKAILEIRRTLKSGGKFLHLDFGNGKFGGQIFDSIVYLVTKILGKKALHYKYLVDSKNLFPPPNELIKEFETAGFKLYTRRDYLFGVISVQIVIK
ncbi:ubiquinone/menaquinone biosynthesis methyltransferase [bacterium]|nr:ubiquinone/menaquinone biosynthesis methyltransferase [bacterium]